MDSMDEGIENWIRANVFSLVGALGGPGVEDGRYRLGHEALSVFKDLKRWNKAWDLDKNRLDVARACAEANLVKGDLLEILATWDGEENSNRLLSKAALYSTDLLNILTWPLPKDEQNVTAQALTHGPYLETAQAGYKRAILHHDHAQILRQTVRVCLPALAMPRNERDGWAENILKVVLYLYRNLLSIGDSEGRIEDDNEIARYTTIDIFHKQDVFQLLLTIGSGLSDDFEGHDTEILEVMFQLCKGIDVDRLFMEQTELMSSNTRELKALMSKEKTVMASYAKTAPSRHNRFGTMMWLKRDDGRHLTVFGHTASNEEATLHEMDKSKKWKKPRRPNKQPIESPLHEFNAVVSLTGTSRSHLRSFVEQFLDSSFNPLFSSMRRSIERELPRVLAEHRRMYFFLISWLLRAERARRRKRRAEQQQRGANNEESESFALVASVLNHETLVLLNRSMQTSLDNKEWHNLQAGMRCFTEILHTVAEMLDSPMEDDQEIAENTLNRIFYEQTTHDRITAMLRSVKDQGFSYLDAVTDLAHTFIRLLERYAKQNTDMQVRSIRRTRKKKQARAEALGEGVDMPNDRVLEVEDVAEAQRVSTERNFDFKRFSARFVNQATIETFARLLTYYKELTTEQLKRTHRFFYRAAFKMDQSVFLMRLDYIQLMYNMIRGPEPMNREDPTFKDWEELSKQVFRKLQKKMEQRPALAVEILFTKIPNTSYYLEHGFDKEVPKKTPRLPAEMEVKPGMDSEQQISVAVTILVNQAKSDALAWVKSVLNEAADERSAWEAEHQAQLLLAAEHEQPAEEPEAEREAEAEAPAEDAAQDRVSAQPNEAPQPEKPLPNPMLVKADTDERRAAMSKDKFLRLLLSLINFEKLEIGDSDIERDGILTSWTIPGKLTSDELRKSAELISRFEFTPPSYEEGKTAEDFVRRKTAAGGARQAQAEGARQRPGQLDSASESEGGSIASDLDAELFPAGGPTARKPDHQRKRIARRRDKHAKDSLIPEEVLEARREAKRKAEREKTAKIKSQLFISPSDDESDDERDRAFFEREANLRRIVGRDVELAQAQAAHGTTQSAPKPKSKPSGRKRKAPGPFSDSTDEESSASDADRPPRQRRRREAPVSESESASEPEGDFAALAGLRSSSPALRVQQGAPDSEADTDTTPASSQRPSSGHVHADKDGEDARRGEDDEDAAMSSEAHSDSDKENAGPPASSGAPKRMQSRRALVIDSDSDD